MIIRNLLFVLFLLSFSFISAQTKTVYIAPCAKIEIDTNDYWTYEMNDPLPPSGGHFQPVGKEMSTIQVMVDQAGGGSSLPYYIEKWDSLELLPIHENLTLERSECNGFNIVKEVFIPDECNADIGYGNDEQLNVRLLAWKKVEENIYIRIVTSHSQDSQEKRMLSFRKFLQGITVLSLSEFDAVFDLPWDQRKYAEKKETFEKETYEYHSSYFLKKKECFDEEELVWMLSRKFTEARIDSLQNANDNEKLAHLYGLLMKEEIGKRYATFYSWILSSGFSFKEKYSLSSRLMTDPPGLNEFCNYYFENAINNDLYRAARLGFLGNNEHAFADGYGGSYGGYYGEEYGPFSESYYQERIRLDDFNDLFSERLNIELFNDSIDISDIDLSLQGEHCVADFSFYHSDFEEETWIGVFAKTKDQWKFRKIELPVYNDDDMRVWNRKETSEDYIILYQPYYVSDSTSWHKIMPLAGINAEWFVIPFPQIASYPGQMVYTEFIDSYDATTFDTYATTRVQDVNKINSLLLDELILSMSTEDSLFVRKTDPLLDGFLSYSWIKIRDGLWVNESEFKWRFANTLHTDEISYATDIIYHDLNGDKVDEAYYFVLSNGKLIDYKIYTLLDGKMAEAKGKSWLKMLQATQGYANLVLFSQIGKRRSK